MWREMDGRKRERERERGREREREREREMVSLICKITVPFGKFRSPYPGKAQQPQEQRYPFLPECAVFSCVQSVVWLSEFGIVTVLVMLVHARRLYPDLLEVLKRASICQLTYIEVGVIYL